MLRDKYREKNLKQLQSQLNPHKMLIFKKVQSFLFFLCFCSTSSRKRDFCFWFRNVSALFIFLSRHNLFPCSLFKQTAMICCRTHRSYKYLSLVSLHSLYIHLHDIFGSQSSICVLIYLDFVHTSVNWCIATTVAFLICSIRLLLFL